ncbi:hypothetical protein [Halalkalibacterium halodurans]|uniref:hypothetical protein n=1 Tax=Halalkalibacterium halodurans TaxID=86665 RepID=UPI002AAA209A|nr:hypothetical protein [Halalkalibacterium halodurans]MDY7224640.1 hypothetical protein [Halalkalibacterium halodurans]MDY7243253.1 hypothetical protein [Halalkalibacterium halodurans]
MKYHDAQQELRRILREQKTVSVPKLKKLLNSMNVSLKKPKGINHEVEFLKEENRRLRKRLAEKERS